MDNFGPKYDFSLDNCNKSSKIKSHVMPIFWIKIAKMMANKNYVDLIYLGGGGMTYPISSSG